MRFRQSLLTAATVLLIAGFPLRVAAAPKERAAPRFTLTEAAPPPGMEMAVSQAVALNDRGQVVVQWVGGKASGCYLWEPGKAPLPLGTLPNGYRLEPVAINNRGQIVGTAWDSSATGHRRRRAFLWERGKARDLGTPDGDFSQAYAINNRGEVYVTSYTFDDPAKPKHVTKQGAFLWSEAKGFVPLPPQRFGDRGSAAVLNDRGQIAGNGWITQEEQRDTLAKVDNRILPDTDGALPGRAFLYENETFRRLPVERSWSTRADAINNRGDVLLSVEMLFKRPYTLPGALFLWRNGQAKLLLAPVGGSSSFLGSGVAAVSLNDAGDVAATLAPPRAAGTQPWMFPVHDEKNRAVLYRGGVLYHLDDCIGKDSGWRLTSVRKINNRGQILGTGMYQGKRRAFLLT